MLHSATRTALTQLIISTARRVERKNTNAGGPNEPDFKYSVKGYHIHRSYMTKSLAHGTGVGSDTRPKVGALLGDRASDTGTLHLSLGVDNHTGVVCLSAMRSE